MSILEAKLDFDVAVVCIQKTFLGNQSIFNSGFNLYQPFRTNNQKDMQVLVAVRKNIFNKVIIDNQTDLVSYLYCLVLNIQKLYIFLKKVLTKTRIVNLYNKEVRKKQ